MKDRIPTYPGRVRLTPVSGQTNVYDLERVDEPTEAGTPLNKANLLTDATATLMGLTTANATVNNALAAVWSLASAAKASADVFAGSRLVETGTYAGRGGTSASLEFSASPMVVVVFDISGAVYAPLAVFTPQGGVAFISSVTNGNAHMDSSVSGNTLTWTGSGGASMNTPGTTYYYIAFLNGGQA